MLHSRHLGSFLQRAMNFRVEEPKSVGKRVLVAGLGNYSMRGTRHSVGMSLLSYLANKLHVGNQWETDRQCHADVVVARMGDLDLVLMKPRRFMNVNGLSVAAAVEAYDLPLENVYLVHDDLDKPLGKVSLKMGGSARGHNGVRSCINSLRSDNMIRLRIGIGRPVGELSVDHYVLSYFTTTEQTVLPQVFEKASEMLLGHIQKKYGIQKDPAASGKEAKAPLKT